MRRVARLLLAVAVAGSTPLAAPASASGRTEMAYVVSAHADDEPAAWGLIANRPDTYLVLVTMTEGEGTTACKRPADAPAPADPTPSSRTLPFVEGLRSESELEYESAHKYQGPGSPVGQPDLGERHPYGNPWVGQQTAACKRARVASWHWFHDAMARVDASLPDFGIDDPWTSPTYRGRFCDRTLRPKVKARRDDSGCASVWATASGARVSFDLGNVNWGAPESDHLTAVEVTRALAVLRANRARWGIAVLPEAGVVSAVPEYGPGACMEPHHADHAAVLRAVYDVDHGAGPQYGPAACPTDPYYVADPGPAKPIPREVVDMSYVDPVTEQRIGPLTVEYGWLWNTYTYGGDPAGTFWQRFG